jgi:amino acid adenylation domain-containing protein
MHESPLSADLHHPAAPAGDVPGRLFSYGVRHWADKIAISDGKSHYTFHALEQMALRLAHWLQQQGVQPGSHVPVLAQKQALMPVLAVAAWKVGAVYVPLDSQQPPARLQQLLARLDARVVLAFGGTPLTHDHQWLIGDALRAVCTQHEPLPEGSAHPLQAADSAYIIFTSGSTGEPKGVEISVGSLYAYFRAHNEVLQFTGHSRVFSLAPFHFDVSIEDTLLPLSLGAYVYQFNGVHAGAIMRSVIIREAITHLIAVSTLLTLITEGGAQVRPENFPALEMVMTGAEVCDPKVINTWKTRLPQVRLINAYGPTETTIVCLCYTIEQADEQRTSAYPIGLPLAGVETLILLESGRAAATGEDGELCIGGELVMKGYLGRPDLTAQVIFQRDGVRFYRTGDICRRLPDGNILYLGRRDDEVKLAGRRIHLGEIRQQCLASPGVARAAVRLIERDGKPQIAVVLSGHTSGLLAQVEAHLATVLPVYMRPTLWGLVEEVNLSTTGKTDERQLLDQLAHAAGQLAARYFLRPEGGAFIPLTGADHEAHSL